MKIHHHQLAGCSPAPLAHYLKALGVFRLIAQQKDNLVRGYWEKESFHVLTRLDRHELEKFFLDEYAPTPFVAPWNKGSGFHPKDNKTGIDSIRRSKSKRLDNYRAAIKFGEKLVRRYPLDSDGKENKENKFRMIQEFFRISRNESRQWIESSIVLKSSIVLTKDTTPAYPAIWGSGGNDGHLDFTNNVMRRIDDLLCLSSENKSECQSTAAAQLRHALWEEPDNHFGSEAIGQFHPGAAGGANSSSTVKKGDAHSNPWDFLLMLEGAVLLSCRASRRLAQTSLSKAAAPFVMHSRSMGYSTSGKEDERGEQWLPLWSNPSAYTDISSVFGEARLQTGRRSVATPLDAVRAVSRLGLARGIDQFTRFAYFERNGKAYLSVPLGRVPVTERPICRLLDDLTNWIERLDRLSKEKGAPASLRVVHRQLADAVFYAYSHDASPLLWQSILRFAVEVEAIQHPDSIASKAGRIPRLRPQWLVETNDGSVEYRLALSFGGAAAGYYQSERGFRVRNPIREHWLRTSGDHQRRHVFTGYNPVLDFSAVVQQRFVDSSSDDGTARRLPLDAHPGFHADLNDLSAVLDGSVDLHKVSVLARAFMAVNWQSPSTRHTTSLIRKPVPKGEHDRLPEEGWLAVRLACLPWPLDSHHDIRCEPAMIRHLLSGDGGRAASIAFRRLRASGLRPPIREVYIHPGQASLWAAALAFPISEKSARRAARNIDPAF